VTLADALTAVFASHENHIPPQRLLCFRDAPQFDIGPELFEPPDPMAIFHDMATRSEKPGARGGVCFRAAATGCFARCRAYRNTRRRSGGFICEKCRTKAAADVSGKDAAEGSADTQGAVRE
jgi:hypothetical protein